MYNKEMREMMLFIRTCLSALEQVTDEYLNRLNQTPEEECRPKELAAETDSAQPKYDTSFFIINEHQSYADCERQLHRMLGGNKVKAKVLRRLFGEEGRRYFDLIDRELTGIVALLNQFPSACGPFSIDVVKKALAQFRPIIEQQRLSRLTKHKSS